MHFNGEKEESRILRSLSIQSFVLFIEKPSYTKVTVAHTSVSLYDTTIIARLLQILQLRRYIKTEGKRDECFTLVIAAPTYCKTPGTLVAYKNLGFEQSHVVTELWTQLSSNKLICLPRYTFRCGIIKYRIPMIQFYREDSFQKPKIKKIIAVFLLSVKGIFEYGLRYPALSNRGHAVKLDLDNASRKIATSMKTFMKKAQQDKNPSLAHHEPNVTVIEDSINHLVSKTCRPMISFASILNHFNQVRLRLKKLSLLYVSETVMELLISVLVVGMKQCQFSVFSGVIVIFTPCPVPNAAKQCMRDNIQS